MTTGGRTAAKKTATTKKTAAKTTGARKTASKKTASRSGSAESPSSRGEATRQEDRHEEPRRTQSDGAPERKKPAAMKIARSAAEQLSLLTGREPETVTGIHRSDEGWEVELEVLETRRIPDSTDILATYRVEVDEDGDLVGYRRVRRYARGRGGDWDGDGGRA